MALRKRLHVLTCNDNPNSFSFAYPLMLNREKMRQRGLDVRFFFSLNKGLYGCEAIFVDSKFFRNYISEEEKERMFGALDEMRRSAGTLLWFDTTDSSGTPQFKVLPHVDGYYKSQVLKDSKMYMEKLYGARVVSDYFHRVFKVEDELNSPFVAHLPEPGQMEKIHVSWNQALNDHSIFGNNYSLLGNILCRSRRYIPLGLRYRGRFISPGRQKKSDITCRFGLSHPRGFVRFHRNLLKEGLNKYGVKTDPVSRLAYYRELADSKISVSPVRAWRDNIQGF